MLEKLLKWFGLIPLTPKIDNTPAQVATPSAAVPDPVVEPVASIEQPVKKARKPRGKKSDVVNPATVSSEKAKPRKRQKKQA